MSTLILENLTVISCAVIIIWFAFRLKSFLSAVDKNPLGDYEQPREIATLGVLGTFIGIALGLLNFDPNTIQQSVTNLLDGMKTAFLTSILGMAGSVGMKFYQSRKAANFDETEIVDNQATIADLILYLKKSDEAKSEALRDFKDSIEKLTASIGGEGEYTVISQIQKIRLDLRDNNDKIIREFEKFSKTLAENNTKAFIEALNETMKDFNQKLTEQFGENFKQLNIAVGRLLEWQINYKATVESVTKNLEATFTGLDAAKNSVAEIEKSSGAIKNSSEQILDLIVTANVYEQKLEQVLIEIKTLGESAQNAVPSITNLTKTTCNEIKTVTEQAAQNVNSYVTGVADNLSVNMRAVSDSSNQMMAKMTADISNSSKVAFNEIKTVTEQAAQNVNSYVTGVTDDLSAKMLALTDSSNQMMAKMTADISNSSKVAFNEIKTVTEQAAQNVNSYVTGVADNLSVNMRAVSDSSNQMMANIIADLDKITVHAGEMTTQIINTGNTTLNQVAEFAQGTCKVIQNCNDKAVQNISNTAIRAGEMTEKISNLSSASINRLDEISKRIESTSYKQREIMDAEVQATKNAVQKAAAVLGEDAFKITKNITDSLQRMMETNNESLKKSSENLSKDLKIKIEESVEKFGDALFLVSEKFVKDYTPLTEKLAALVHVSERR